MGIIQYSAERVLRSNPLDGNASTLAMRSARNISSPGGKASPYRTVPAHLLQMQAEKQNRTSCRKTDIILGTANRKEKAKCCSSGMLLDPGNDGTIHNYWPSDT